MNWLMFFTSFFICSVPAFFMLCNIVFKYEDHRYIPILVAWVFGAVITAAQY